MHLTFPIRVILTLLMALAAASLCVFVHTPIPWMIGPLLSTALVSVLGGPAESWTPLRNAGQLTIGTALGLYFTPQVVALVASLWWAILLAIVWALAMGYGFGLWLQRLHGDALGGELSQQRATTYFAGAIGGATEMTLLAEQARARTDLVASAHSMRLLIVIIAIPFGMQFSGLHGIDLVPAGPKVASWPGMVWLGLAASAGALLLRWAGRNNPWFLGALMVASALTVAGISWSAIPPWLSNTAQLLIGISLGVRFSAEFVHTAPRWLGSVVLGTVVMLALCALFAWALAWCTGLHAATLILGTSPGGIAEMAITAKVLQLGVPVVTAFQVCRLVAVLLLVNPIYVRFFSRTGVSA